MAAVFNAGVRTRTLTCVSVVLTAVTAAYADQIQIGGTNGLTNAYVTSGGTTGGATEQNYDVNLFQGAANGSKAPQPYATYSTTAANQGTITDPTFGITYNVIDDGLDASGNSSNFWMLNSTGDTTMTIPIGIFGVTSVWTLTNAIGASDDGSRDENIIFVFGTTPTGGTLTNVELKLSNSGNGASSGEIQNALSCPSSAACSGLSNASPVSSASLTSVGGTGLTSGLPVTVLTNSVYTSPYNDDATGVYAGTSGSLGLEDEGFLFTGSALTTAENEYLVDIEFKDPSTSQSALGISAITVDPTQAAQAPEPSSAFLLFGGLGSFAIGRLLKRFAAKTR